MKIDNFILENWLNPACDSEKNQVYLGGSCVEPLTVKELFDLTGENMNRFLDDLKSMSLGYGNFEGTPKTRQGIASLYQNISPEEVILVHGGTGANNTVLTALIEPGDNIISVMPNYQQFYSIPKSLGAQVQKVDLKPEAGYKLNLEEVRQAADKNTRAILLTNPNNPTGSLLSLEEMQELVKIAESAGAWIVCDEMYRGLKEEYMYSFTDIYDKAIATASSSKIYSMAGTRVGWIICRDPDMRQELFNRRSFDSICGGVFDEWIFGIALEHSDKIFQRSRRIVQENKKLIDQWLKDHKYLRQYANAWGTTYLLHYNLDIDAETFCNDLLDKKGVLVCHGDCFYLPHTFRMCLSHSGALKKGMELIDEYLEELVNSGVPLL